MKEVELLRSAITEIKHKLESSLQVLRSLKKDTVVVTMQSIGDSEDKWIAFLQSKRENLENERMKWLMTLAELERG